MSPKNSIPLVALLIAPLLSCGHTDHPAEKLVIYPHPEECKGSDAYRVKARLNGQDKWREVFVYQSISQVDSTKDASWVTFSFDGSVEVVVTTLKGTVDSALIKPGAFNIQPGIEDNTIRFTIDEPRKLSVECNGDTDHPLFIFADSPETDIPEESDDNVMVFGPGMHDIGDRYPLESDTTYYLAGGAYVKGSFYGGGVTENVTITGRGILSSRYQKWIHPSETMRSNIAFEDGRNIVIEGITLIEAGNFQIKHQVKQENTRNVFQNLKMIGWNKNTDGIHVSDMDWHDHPVIGNAGGTIMIVSDCFIMANDDAVLTCDGVAESLVENCVFRDQGYGATICLSWGGHQDVTSSVIRDCHVINKFGDNPVFRARHAGEAHIKNVLVDNVHVDGSIATLVGLQILDHPYDRDPGHGRISDIVFRNVTVEGTCERNWLRGHDANHQISDIVFDNLVIDNKKITDADAANIEMNSFVENVSFR